MKSTYQRLLDLRRQSGAGFLVLLDPDSASPHELGLKAATCQAAAVDAILIGGSLMMRDGFSEAVTAVKQNCKLPVIIFPGGPTQLSADADAVLFLSLISGRNPQHLIGDHVVAAPVVKRLGLETIPTGYMLIGSGSPTAVEFMSDTRPLPPDKPDLAAVHALAGQYLGLKLIYLEAGSGARSAVPVEVIAAVRRWVDLPLIVGGGIRTPDQAAAAVEAGADFIVIGTALEGQASSDDVARFADVVHRAGRGRSKR
ncbi:MAG: geranylgeranylglyceryl/heptaprenylglyceryl phosphate synthase [bacterium]|nr:geranylgeranylglyceryl/heptaprenylglyceryl phosphate synthase [bacterium]